MASKNSAIDDEEILSGIRNTSGANKTNKVDVFISSDKSVEYTQEFYDKWAETYDKDLSKIVHGYNNPQIITNYMSEYLKKEFRILDVGAGTGLVGIELHKLGLKDVDALDGSSQMLEKAKEKNNYRNYFCEFVTEEKLKFVNDDSYDAVLTTGTFCPGHLSSKCLRTIGRAVKPGGYVAICIRESFLEHPFLKDLEAVMQELSSESFWKLLKRDVVSFYYGSNNGVVFIFQRL